MYNEKNLKNRIIASSTATTWEEAKTEWYLSEIVNQPLHKPAYCLCGHKIFVVNSMHNVKNNNITHVGSCCVKKFMGWRPNLIVRCINAVKKEKLHALNQATIDFVKERGWLSDEDIQYLMDTRSTPPNDYMDRRRRINADVLAEWNWAQAGETRPTKVDVFADNAQRIHDIIHGQKADKPATVYKTEHERTIT